MSDTQTPEDNRHLNLFPPISERDVFMFDGEAYEAHAAHLLNPEEVGDHSVLPLRMRHRNMRGRVTDFMFDYDPDEHQLTYKFARFNHAGFPVKKFYRLPEDIAPALEAEYLVEVVTAERGYPVEKP